MFCGLARGGGARKFGAKVTPHSNKYFLRQLFSIDLSKPGFRDDNCGLWMSNL